VLDRPVAVAATVLAVLAVLATRTGLPVPGTAGMKRDRTEWGSRVSGLALASQVTKTMYVQRTITAERTRGRDSPRGPGAAARMIKETGFPASRKLI